MKSYTKTLTSSKSYKEFLLKITDEELLEMWIDSEKERSKTKLSYRDWIHVIYRGCRLRDGIEPEYCRDPNFNEDKECDYYNCVIMNIV